MIAASVVPAWEGGGEERTRVAGAPRAALSLTLSSSSPPTAAATDGLPPSAAAAAIVVL